MRRCIHAGMQVIHVYTCRPTIIFMHRCRPTCVAFALHEGQSFKIVFSNRQISKHISTLEGTTEYLKPEL